MVMPSRMIIEESNISNKEYFKNMNETSVIGYSTEEVIISEEKFREIMGIDAYTSLNINLKEGVDYKKIIFIWNLNK